MIAQEETGNNRAKAHFDRCGNKEEVAIKYRENTEQTEYAGHCDASWKKEEGPITAVATCDNISG